MSVLKELSSSMGYKDDKQNRKLAKDIANKKDKTAIKELVKNLYNNDKRIASDCIKVLYEIGYIDNSLICDYTDIFIKLLADKNNRMVWGGMIALSTIAKCKAEEIIKNFKAIKDAIEFGSVITVDKGIKTLADVASVNEEYNKKLKSYLLKKLKKSRSQSFPQYAESIAKAYKDDIKFIMILKERLATLSEPRKKRVEKILRKLKKGGE